MTFGALPSRGKVFKYEVLKWQCREPTGPSVISLPLVEPLDLIHGVWGLCSVVVVGGRSGRGQILVQGAWYLSLGNSNPLLDNVTNCCTIEMNNCCAVLVSLESCDGYS